MGLQVKKNLHPQDYVSNNAPDISNNDWDICRPIKARKNYYVSRIDCAIKNDLYHTLGFQAIFEIQLIS